jgi:hypothetical protein
MGGFLNTTQINKLMGWRNYATTKQSGASFNSPSFPPDLTHEEYFASNFLGAAYPLTTSFTTVSSSPKQPNGPSGDDRQELIKLQRTLDNPWGSPQSLLQHLGRFPANKPAPDWPKVTGNNLTDRFDMTNLHLMIPGYAIHHGNGKVTSMALTNVPITQLFGLVWVPELFNARSIDPNYYGHWKYIHNLSQLPANPDFFQIIDYAMNRVNGGASNPQKTFQVGAALIDQYDSDDLDDPDPNLPNGSAGNTITIIDYGGASYAYGIEGMS